MLNSEYNIEELEYVAMDLKEQGDRNILQGSNHDEDSKLVDVGWVYLELHDQLMEEIQRRESPGVFDIIRRKFR